MVVINPMQLLVREVLLNSPVLDYVLHHNRVPHALISGDYENIKWLVFEIANICHYPSLVNARVTLVGNQSQDQMKMLIEEFPKIDEVIELSNISKPSTTMTEKDFESLDVTAIFISEKMVECSHVTAFHLYRLSHINGIGDINISMFNFGCGPDDIYDTKILKKVKRIDFNMFNESCIIDYLDTYDLVAKSIHDYYQQQYGGVDEFESLSETLKMSNRYQAYHTKVKLGYFILGYKKDDKCIRSNKIKMIFSKNFIKQL